MGATVQFFGLDNVMKAAENINCSAWGIYINRAMFTKYEGASLTESLAMLQRNLEALEEAGTTGIYTLKFFEPRGKEKIKINEKTTCDGGSFNFKLIEPAEREAKLLAGSSQYGIISQMQKDIDALKKEKQDLEDALSDEPDTIGAVVLDLIKNPAQLAQLINVGRSLVGLPAKNFGAAIGALPGEAMPSDMPGQTSMDRLEHALDTLEKADPTLILHLEKLARLSVDNPKQFQGILSMLDFNF